MTCAGVSRNFVSATFCPVGAPALRRTAAFRGRERVGRRIRGGELWRRRVGRFLRRVCRGGFWMVSGDEVWDFLLVRVV